MQEDKATVKVDTLSLQKYISFLLKSKLKLLIWPFFFNLEEPKKKKNFFTPDELYPLARKL